MHLIRVHRLLLLASRAARLAAHSMRALTCLANKMRRIGTGLAYAV
jgi:hypothetical protein